MPPATAVTTAGYWGSSYWSKGYWGADYWKERVPVPVPPRPVPRKPTSSARGGLRCAATIPCADPRPEPEDEESFIKCAIGILNDRITRTESDLFPVKRGPGPDRDKIEKIRKLNERIARYKERLRNLRLENERLKRQNDRVGELEETVARLEARIAAMAGREPLLFQAGMTFSSVAVRGQDGTRVAVFSGADLGALGSILIPALQAFTWAAEVLHEPQCTLDASSALPLARRLGEILGHRAALVGATGKVRAALAAGGEVVLASVEVAALATLMEVALEIDRASGDAMQDAVLTATVGLGVPAVFSALVLWMAAPVRA